MIIIAMIIISIIMISSGSKTMKFNNVQLFNKHLSTSIKCLDYILFPISRISLNISVITESYFKMSKREKNIYENAIFSRWPSKPVFFLSFCLMTKRLRVEQRILRLFSLIERSICQYFISITYYFLLFLPMSSNS